MQQQVQRLIVALEDLIAAFDTERLLVEEMQKQSETTHQRFTSMMQSMQSGSEENLAASRQQRVEEMRNSLSSSSAMESIQTAARLSMRREQALSDSCDALMRLYAFPEARPAAERIMDAVRVVRLLQMQEGAKEFPTFDAPPVPPALETSEEGSAERKRRMAGMAQNWVTGMDGYVEKTRQTYLAMSEQTRHLLLEALSEAKNLAGG
jgi:hypothetical protein